MNPKNASKILCNLALALVFILPTQAGAQAYVPVDGELDLTNCGLVTVLDPRNRPACLVPGFAPTAAALNENIYRFSKILIPAGKTLKLTGQHFNMAPLYFLTGDDPQDGYAVDIAGTIDLSGAIGESGVQGNGTPHSPAMPGPGGWPGGVFFKRNAVIDAELGNGGGPAGGPQEGGREGRNSVTLFMNPFFGGSGGAAAATESEGSMCSGSAGGGALEIVSSGRVRINGVVDARGGGRPSGWACTSGAPSGAGAGGSVRVLAQSILGSGNINVGSTYSGVGGVVRLEASVRPDAFTVNAMNGRVSRVTRAANASFLPGAQPRLWIRSIGGIDVPQCMSNGSPVGQAEPCGPTSGGFNPADFNIATGEAVVIVVHAINVPSGRSPQARLRVYNEESGAAVPVTVILGAPEGNPPPPYLEGRFSVTFEPGFSRVQLDASWNP
jgi:hypothetical protein